MAARKWGYDWWITQTHTYGPDGLLKQSKETDSFFLKKGTGVMVSYIIKRSYDDSGNLINERKFATDTYKELSSIFKGRFKRFNKKGRHNN